MMSKFPEYLGERYFIMGHDAGKCRPTNRHIDRMPFIVNKPVNEEAVSQELMHRHVAPNKVFIGIAGLRALDLLSSAGKDSSERYGHAVLFDVNYRQVKAINAILRMIQEAQTPQEFIEAFTQNYDALLAPPKSSKRHVDPAFLAVHGANRDIYQPDDVQNVRDYLLERSQRSDSFLQPDNFAHLKTLLNKQQVHTAVLDLLDIDRVGALTKWMNKNGLETGDMYVSSVLDFFIKNQSSDYWGRTDDNQKKLLCENLWSMLDGSGRLLYSQPATGGAGFTLEEFYPENRGKVYGLIDGYAPTKFYHERLAHGSLSLIVEAQTFGDTGEKLLIEAVSGGPFVPQQVEILTSALKPYDVSDLKLSRNGISVTGHGSPEYDNPIRNSDSWKSICDAIKRVIATHEFQSFVTPVRGAPDVSRNPAG